MTATHRCILLLAAFPTSAVLVACTLLLPDVSWGTRILLASGVFFTVEMLLAAGLARIPPRMGPETLAGTDVNALTDFTAAECGAYTGYVQLAGERWRAQTAGSVPTGPRTGQRLRIERVEGLTLLVAPLPVSNQAGVYFQQ